MGSFYDSICIFRQPWVVSMSVSVFQAAMGSFYDSVCFFSGCHG